MSGMRVFGGYDTTWRRGARSAAMHRRAGGRGRGADVGRVAARFRDNGQGVAGDMKAVVKAVLLDTEARDGDRPGGGRADDGKLREPFLHLTAVWRGLGCTRVPTLSYGPSLPQGQMPIGAESVFSFYAPTDRAPGSNLLAPEQKIVNASEFQSRLNLTYGMRWDNGLPQPSLTAMLSAGCGVDTLAQAYAASPAAFLAQLAERFFRGTMPPTLRSGGTAWLSRRSCWMRPAPPQALCAGTPTCAGYAALATAHNWPKRSHNCSTPCGPCLPRVVVCCIALARFFVQRETTPCKRFFSATPMHECCPHPDI